MTIANRNELCYLPCDMGGETAALPTDVEGLQRLVRELRKEISYLSSRSGVLQEELQLLRHKIFGRRSERFSSEELRQSSLFDEAEHSGSEQVEQLSEPTIEVAAHRRAKRGRKPLALVPNEAVAEPEEELVAQP